MDGWICIWVSLNDELAVMREKLYKVKEVQEVC